MSKQTLNIFLNSDGSFPQKNDMIYSVRTKSDLNVRLNSNLSYNNQPILLKNKPKCFKNIDKQQQLTFKQLEESYEIIKHRIELDGTYIYKINCDVPESIQLQLIFVTESEQGFWVESFGKEESILIQDKINLESMTLQTLLPSQLGHFNNWKQFIEQQIQMYNYNAFHLPPIQKLGCSNSLYSINDQLKYNEKLFEGIENPEQEIKDLIQYFVNKYDAKFFIDIIMNHTSIDTQWLLSNEDSYYNIKNTPNLNSALILDNFIQDFFSNVQKIKQLNKDDVLKRFKHQLEELNFQEFFQFDIESNMKVIREKFQMKELDSELPENDNIFVQNNDIIIYNNLEKTTTGFGEKRFGLKIDLQSIEQHMSKHKDSYAYENVQVALNELNNKWYKNIQIYLQEIYNSVKNELNYTLTLQNCNCLIQPYFTKLANGEYATNNGWIQDQFNNENTAESQQFYYFRRKVHIWGDNVKLRYGKQKEDSKFLWKHMKNYVIQLSKIFQGFRLDNLHNTSLEMIRYMSFKIRKQNPQILFMAELFTDQLTKAKYVKQLGINMLVSETNRCYDTNALYGALHGYGNQQQFTLGKLKSYYFQDNQAELRQQYTPKIVYDQTHDNEPYSSNFGYKQALSNLSCISFSKVIYGTTKGYDEFYNQQVHVVNNERLYEPNDFHQYNKKQRQITVLLAYWDSKEIENFKQIQEIEVRGSWDIWKDGIKLEKLGDHLYQSSLELSDQNIKDKYQYKFIVNGTWICHPDQPIENDNNILALQGEILNKN